MSKTNSDKRGSACIALLSGEVVESTRPHDGRQCDCGKKATIYQIHTGKKWQYAYEWMIRCECGLKTCRSTAITDVMKLWDHGYEPSPEAKPVRVVLVPVDQYRELKR